MLKTKTSRKLKGKSLDTGACAFKAIWDYAQFNSSVQVQMRHERIGDRQVSVGEEAVGRFTGWHVNLTVMIRTVTRRPHLSFCQLSIFPCSRSFYIYIYIYRYIYY